MKSKEQSKTKQNKNKQNKKKKKKKVLRPAPCYATGALRPTCLRNSFLSGDPDLLGGGPVNNSLRGALSAAADTADS